MMFTQHDVAELALKCGVKGTILFRSIPQEGICLIVIPLTIGNYLRYERFRLAVEYLRPMTVIVEVLFYKRETLISRIRTWYNRITGKKSIGGCYARKG